jgi:hypothetical protein
VDSRKPPPGIYLAYASERSGDGLGAQAQRLMGIYAAAKSLGFGYIHKPIASIERNPGDPHSTPEARRDYLQRVNELFALPSTSSRRPRWRMSFMSLSQKNLDRLRWLDRIARLFRFAIQVDLPFSLPWSDLVPDSYELPSEIIRPRMVESNSTEEFRVDLHIRRALAPKTGRDGNPYDRYVPTEWYVHVAGAIQRAAASKGFQPVFRIHTDIPSSRWKVPEDTSSGTLGMWRHHRLVDGEGYLVDPREDLESQFHFLRKVEIAREWDPLDAIKSMATSTVLVTYASSMSYVAGLLRGTGITVSPKFFHATPTTWCTLTADPGLGNMSFTSAQVESFIESRLSHNSSP